MADERSEALGRLSTTSEAIARLREVFAAEEPLQEVTGRVAATAISAIRHADGVSITIVSGPGTETCGHSDDWALSLDRQQYASGRGPCLDAARSRNPVRADLGTDECRWPEFVEAARQEGIHACLSLPLEIRGADKDEHEELLGSLNVYSYTPSAFDEFDQELMRLFTVTAGEAVTNARRWQESRQTVTQLEQALVSRTDIDQAKGVLRALHGYSADEAFAELVKHSQRWNVRVHDIACEILAALTASTTDDS